MAINKTIEQIREEVLRIKNETVAKANTATRVGGALEDIVDHIEDAVDGVLADVQAVLTSETTRATAKELELQEAFEEAETRIYSTVFTDNTEYSSEDLADGFYNTNKAIGDAISDTVNQNANWHCVKVQVNGGMQCVLRTEGGANALAWAVTDRQRTLRAKSEPSVDTTSTPVNLTISQDGYLYINCSTAKLSAFSLIVRTDRIALAENKLSNVDALSSAIGEPETHSFTITTAKAYNIPLIASSGETIKFRVDATGVLNDTNYSPIYANEAAGSSIGRIYGDTTLTVTLEQDVTQLVLYVRSANLIQSGEVRFTLYHDGIVSSIADTQEQVETLREEVQTEVRKRVHKRATVIEVLKKQRLKILDLGNSFSANAWQWVGDMLTNMSISTSDICMYQLVRGGASWKSYYDMYHDEDTKAYTWRKKFGFDADTTDATGSIGDGSLFRQVLDEPWDVILVHTESTYSHDYSVWQEHEAGGYLNEFMRILRALQPSAVIGTYIVHSSYVQSSEGDTLSRWRLIADSTYQFCREYGIDIVVPYGTAIESLRLSDLNTSEHGLSYDSHHLADGIALWTAAATTYQSILAPRFGKSILECDYNRAIEETTEAIPVTAANMPTLRMCALLACDDMYTAVIPDGISL